MWSDEGRGRGMQTVGGQQRNPELRELVVEASLALARLDAERLEELAVCCRALNRGLAGLSGEDRAEFQRQAHGASRDMEVFGRVLAATEAHLEVMNRVHERMRGGLEYAGRRTAWVPWSRTEKCDGNH